MAIGSLISFLKQRRTLFRAMFLILAGAYAIYCRLIDPDLAWFNTHMSRDLSRAMNWASLHPSSQDWFGPELNYNGGRLFGPAYYWVVGLVWSLARSIPATLFILHSITIAISLVYCRKLAKQEGTELAVVFFLLFILMPVHVSLSRTLWNPSLLIDCNLLAILCCHSICVSPEKVLYRFLFLLLTWFSLQIHLSALIGLLACLIVMTIRTRNYRFPIIFAAALIGYSATLLLCGGYFQAFANSLPVQFGLSGNGEHNLAGQFRLNSWLYHLFPDPTPLQDYEQFTLLFRLGLPLFPEKFWWIFQFLRLRYLFYFLFVIGNLVLVGELVVCWKESRKASFYTQLVVVWTFLCFSAFLFYTAKKTLPYRYGISLYPMQFLVVPLAWKSVGRLDFPKLAKRFVSGALFLFSLIIFVGEGYFLLTIYRVMEVTGRASHVARDSFEIPLRYKISLLEFARRNAPEDEVYRYLHGSIANKVRLNEHDWEHTEYFRGILRSLPAFVASEPFPRAHYFVASLTRREMQENALTGHYPFPFHLVRLGDDDLPKSVKITLTGKTGNPVEKALVDGDLIEPLSDVPAGMEVTRVKLAFDVAPPKGKTLKVAYDSSPALSAFHLASAKVEDKPAALIENKPEWLEQKVAMIRVPEGDGKKWQRMELEFTVDLPRDKYSRIDIYENLQGAPHLIH